MARPPSTIAKYLAGALESSEMERVAERLLVPSSSEAKALADIQDAADRFLRGNFSLMPIDAAAQGFSSCAAISGGKLSRLMTEIVTEAIFAVASGKAPYARRALAAEVKKFLENDDADEWTPEINAQYFRTFARAMHELHPASHSLSEQQTIRSTVGSFETHADTHAIPEDAPLFWRRHEDDAVLLEQLDLYFYAGLEPAEIAQVVGETEFKVANLIKIAVDHVLSEAKK